MKTLFLNKEQITEATHKIGFSTLETFLSGTKRAYPMLDIKYTFQDETIDGMLVTINRQMQIPAWNKFQAYFKNIGIEATA